MPASEQRVRDLWDIAERIRVFFPDWTTFKIDGDHGLNIQADWQLIGQPEGLAQRSRPLRLRFSERDLEFYSTAGSEQKDSMCTIVGEIIKRRLADGYDEGREAPYGAKREPFDIDTSDAIG